MKGGAKPPDEPAGPDVLRFDGGRLTPSGHRPVAEFPLSLTVNGIELATLIASPHDLPVLVAGFLRMQGLVARRDDILSLGVCPDSGAANVRIRGDVPPRLKPTLLSGCGGGITFDVPGEPGRKPDPSPGRTFSPDTVFAVMEELTRLAEGYRKSGGIHSAAVGSEDGILLYAEDIGRHNTLDRIAGEALLKGIDLSGTLLAASGRVSSEMAIKAAALGISLIASRTSPTDLAVRICEERGITLAGYVRGRRFNVYSHPWRISLPPEEAKIAGVTGVILAGGSSSRMGSDKALLPWQGGRFIESIHRKMAQLFEEVLLVTNTPADYRFLPCRKVPDLFPGAGGLAGIHSGLRHSGNPYVFVAACDMPSLDGDLVRHIASMREGFDVVVPEGDKGLEPLHAVYGRGALPAIEEALRAGRRRIVSFFDRVDVRKIPREEVAAFDPAFRSFRNINTPEEYFRFREEGASASGDESRQPRTGRDRNEP